MSIYLRQVISILFIFMSFKFYLFKLFSSPNVIFADLPFVMGDSEQTAYVPYIMTSFTDHMTLLERTINTALVHTMAKIPRYFYMPKIDRLVQHYFSGYPSVYDVERNVSLIFTNTHPSFTYPRVHPPNVIEIGAIHCRPAKPLPNVIF